MLNRKNATETITKSATTYFVLCIAFVKFLPFIRLRVHMAESGLALATTPALHLTKLRKNL